MIGYIRRKIKQRNNTWHKWSKIPETGIIYLDEKQWVKFVEWVKSKDWYANSSWSFKFKLKHFLRGWYGEWTDLEYTEDDEEYWDWQNRYVIYIREKYYHPKTLHHEMGHIIQRQHTPWSPGLMNPIWIFRWFT